MKKKGSTRKKDFSKCIWLAHVVQHLLYTQNMFCFVAFGHQSEHLFECEYFHIKFKKVIDFKIGIRVYIHLKY